MSIIIYLRAQPIERIVYLNEDRTSWIKIMKLDDKTGFSSNEFVDLWTLKPKNKLQISIGGHKINCPRYSQSYLKAYNFSGLNHEANMILPERINQLLSWAKLRNTNLNQSLINWYESDGGIGKHSDDTRSLMKDSDVYSFTFGPASRTFILEPRDPRERYQYHLHAEHNTLIIMGGKCQSTHQHSVPKVYNDNNRRINVTFRCFK